MKAVLGTLFAMFACASGAQAQDAVPSSSLMDSNAASEFSFSARPASFLPLALSANSTIYTRTPAASFFAPDPPAPKARRVWPENTDRGDSWQLALCVEHVRFRSAIFNASLTGLHTSVTYFRNDWFGIEGSVVAAFGSSTLNNEPSRFALYTGGPRIAWRSGRWQPWVHALVGGIHVFPQTAFSNGGFAIQLGGGVDWRFKPLVSFRLESDYIRSQLFSAGQNSLQFGGGFVLHF